MKHYYALVAALFAAPLSAENAQDQSDVSTAQAFANLANASCLPLASGSASFGQSAAEDKTTIESFGFSYGISSEVLDRFGRQGSGILNRSVMGHQTVGEDAIVLSVGGALPGCKVILLSTDDAVTTDDVATALSTTKPIWRELSFEAARPGTSVKKRSFIYRDSANKAFILNLLEVPVPDSQIRHVITISPIPPHVKIPEGY